METGFLHDARLVELVYEPNKTIRLKFVTDLGKYPSIVLRDVRRFIATNLLDGNIVLDVLSTKFGNLDLKDVQELVRNAFSGEFQSDNAKRVKGSQGEWEKWIKQITAGQLHVFKIEPSYGFDVVAICSDIEVTDTR